jgi:hypothetical protein
VRTEQELREREMEFLEKLMRVESSKHQEAESRQLLENSLRKSRTPTSNNTRVSPQKHPLQQQGLQAPTLATASPARNRNAAAQRLLGASPGGASLGSASPGRYTGLATAARRTSSVGSFPLASRAKANAFSSIRSAVAGARTPVGTPGAPGAALLSRAPSLASTAGTPGGRGLKAPASRPQSPGVVH